MNIVDDSPADKSIVEIYTLTSDFVNEKKKVSDEMFIER